MQMSACILARASWVFERERAASITLPCFGCAGLECVLFYNVGIDPSLQAKHDQRPPRHTMCPLTAKVAVDTNCSYGLRSSKVFFCREKGLGKIIRLSKDCIQRMLFNWHKIGDPQWCCTYSVACVICRFVYRMLQIRGIAT